MGVIINVCFFGDNKLVGVLCNGELLAVQIRLIRMLFSSVMEMMPSKLCLPVISLNSSCASGGCSLLPGRSCWRHAWLVDHCESMRRPCECEIT